MVRCGECGNKKRRSEPPWFKLKPKKMQQTTTGGDNDNNVMRAYAGDRYLNRDGWYKDFVVVKAAERLHLLPWTDSSMSSSSLSSSWKGWGGSIASAAGNIDHHDPRQKAV
jgi:hypothetical protein